MNHPHVYRRELKKIAAVPQQFFNPQMKQQFQLEIFEQRHHCREVERIDEDDAQFNQSINTIREMIWEDTEQIRTQIREKSFMCEISIAKTGEKQRWNTECSGSTLDFFGDC
ncbi:Macrolide export ATP-binding/permease protein MacB [Corchorus olitorius]|uniref:Macrolide export ATP-binding/permease protein MacB n=1 Tax=Corchorus olitorius TaxID=93759 RepID=A0A1R3KT30_9ROSI|nr:Macrolide export ATP-binding/permease protein MacB [Corchorus olitorius]